jgi:hypothetical protein
MKSMKTIAPGCQSFFILMYTKNTGTEQAFGWNKWGKMTDINILYFFPSIANTVSESLLQY